MCKGAAGPGMAGIDHVRRSAEAELTAAILSAGRGSHWQRVLKLLDGSVTFGSAPVPASWQDWVFWVLTAGTLQLWPEGWAGVA